MIKIFLLILCFWRILGFSTGAEENCPGTPSITHVYVSHTVLELANPKYFVRLYWNPVIDWCNNSSYAYYEIKTCTSQDCSGIPGKDNWTFRESKNIYTDDYFDKTDSWFYFNIRAVNKDGVAGQWSEQRSVYLWDISPEPWLLMSTYLVADVTSDAFLHNPYAFYIQADTNKIIRMPKRIAKKPWPAFFCFECCSSEGVIVDPADPDALYFNLTEDIMNLKADQNIQGSFGIALDWVSVRHFSILRCGHTKSDYCIFHIDDSKRKMSPAEKVYHLYSSRQRIYQMLFNSLRSTLYWSEARKNSELFQLKKKFKNEAETNLDNFCNCMKGLSMNSPAISLDWRPFYANGLDPAVIVIANDSLWQIQTDMSNNCTCSELLSNVTELVGNSTIIQIDNDWHYFYWLDSTGFLYGYNWNTSFVYPLWGQKQQKVGGMITQMKAITHELRPYAPAKCYFPTTKNTSFEMVSYNQAVITVELNWDDSEQCRDIPKPPVNIAVNYTLINSSADPQTFSCSPETKCEMVSETWSRKTKFQFSFDGLEHNKTYFVQTNILPTNQYPQNHQPYENYNNTEEILKYKFSSTFEPETRVPIAAIIGSVSVIVILIILLAVLLGLYFKKWHKYIDIPRVWPYQLVRVKKFDSAKMKDSEVRLGGGRFGDVYLEKYKGEKLVATKYLKENTTDYDEKCFVEEILLMWMTRGNPNIVELLGICLTSRPYRFIMEFIEGSTMFKHLEQRALDKYEPQALVQLESDDERDMLKALNDAARACDRLDKLCIIHRDLAARNLLVEYNRNTGRIDKVKLSDFGLAKEVGQDDKTYTIPYGKARELPFRLFAIECLARNEFSPKSEVWEFGVLIWEIFSLVAAPYSQLEPFPDNVGPYQAVLTFLNSGKRLPRPKYCQENRYDALYNLMLRCWKAQPHDRPTIQQVGSKLEEFSKQQTKPVHKVFPLTMKSASSTSVSLKKQGTLISPSFSSEINQHKGAPGTPSVAYADSVSTLITDSTVSRDDLELQERPILAAKGYKNADRTIPQMTGAYTVVSTESPCNSSEVSETSMKNSEISEDTIKKVDEANVVAGSDYWRPLSIEK